MDPSLRIQLARRLADYEAPWLPIRQHWKSCPAIYARRRGDVSGRLGGGEATARKRHSLDRLALCEAGYLDPAGAITPEGRRLARGWTWPFSMRELFRGLARFSEAIQRGDFMDHGGERLVPETIIAGETWGKQVGWLQAMFLPLLADGVLGSRSTPWGACFYFLADRSADLAAVQVIEPDASFDERAIDAYERQFRAARAAMLADESYYSELGECPTPVVGLKSGRPVSGVGDEGPLFDTEAPGSAVAPN